ncbi:MAG: dynamin family protein, partial [Serpentinimonas sp.]|nr:dynamin family protein [Serpentinimonas sp.]
KLGVKKIYTTTFARLRQNLAETQGLADEVHEMLTGMFRNLNAEYGFTLQAPLRLDLSRHSQAIDEIENTHLQYLGVTNLLRLAQAEFCERLAKAVLSRLRKLYDEASNEVELWSKTAAARLDGQMRERRRNFARRIEAVHRIQEAAGSLDERIDELLARQAEVGAEQTRWEQLCTEVCRPEAAEATVASEPAGVARLERPEPALSPASG